ncbi:MAG: nucleotide exchange factor GrpE [Proteobacteria bacterium]|nr:MAG: nucleotide exchange factor GrpE [Pseudomonadota bacterium]QKK12186.1 MAG: nucleotide exchange factor GrpE [Pseudomonadota bacterium]
MADKSTRVEEAPEIKAAQDAGTGPQAESVEATGNMNPTSGGDELQLLRSQLSAAEAKASENWDQLLRTKAEMDNLRRRTERELESAHKYALDRMAQEILPVIDSLEAGLGAAKAEGASVEKIVEGTELTLKMLFNALEKFGIQAVDPEGERFNPDFHQAMTTQPANHVEPNTVLTVFQKGYLLNDRLLRPALVLVSSGAAQEPGSKVDERA